jgi:hypothetical protein
MILEIILKITAGPSIMFTPMNIMKRSIVPVANLAPVNFTNSKQNDLNFKDLLSKTYNLFVINANMIAIIQAITLLDTFEIFIFL